MPEVRQALLALFPPLESLDDHELDSRGVWSMTPAESDRMLALSCIWPRSDELREAVVELAGKHGLVCYEPSDHALRCNAPGFKPRFTFESASLPAIDNPDADRVEQEARKLSSDNPFVILERADGWWVQVGYGTQVGARPGMYALEYRDTAGHFRCMTTDVNEVVRFLQDFLAGEETWRSRHIWAPLAL